jgi:hypothetical protein
VTRGTGVDTGAVVAGGLKLADGVSIPDDDLDDLQARVTVSREHAEDVRQRQIVVRVDDGPKMTLLFGQSFTVEVQPGTHRLRAHNTLFWKTIRFNVEAGEHLEFVVINRGGAATLAFLALIGAAPLYLTIQQRNLK